MRNLSDSIFKIVAGLLCSSIYLGISFLGSYLSLYWNLWNPTYAWIIIGFTTYHCLLESEEDKIGVNVIGILSIIGIYIYHLITGYIPLLWVYIVVNSIVCLNIIITWIRQKD